MKTYIFDPIHEKALEYAKDKLNVVTWVDKEIHNYLNAEAVIVRTFKMTKDVIDEMPNLKIIAKHGVGVDNIDLDYAKSKGIRVTNTPEANMHSVSELVIGLALNCARKIGLTQKMVEQGAKKNSPVELAGFELQGKIIGLIGLGKIGALVGHKLKAAFNMNVLVFDPYTSEEKCKEEGFTKYDSLESLLKVSDIVSISVPLTKNTENMISAKELSLMKKNAILINTSRGKIINEEDLYQALQNGEIFGAGLDVFAEEPISKDHPLITCNNFIGTLHNGANTEDALIRMGTGAVDEIVRLEEHMKPLSLIV